MKSSPEKTAEQKILTPPPLNQVYFYLTRGCNLACRHCWLAPPLDTDGSRYPVLPVELFRQVITEAIPLGLTSVKLTGGEPLLHPEIFKLLRIIREHSINMTMESNGTLCTKEIASAISELENRFVAVSLDGPDAATHEFIRGVKGSFNQTLEGIHNLVDSGTPPQIIMTVMRSNSHGIEDMIRLAERLGASSLKFNILQPTARGKSLGDSGHSLTVKEIIDLGRHITSTLATETDLQLYFDFPAAFRSLNRIAGNDCGGTCGIFGIMGVIATGHYALCGIGEHIPDLVFGKVVKNTLKDIWDNNPVLQSIRRGIPNKLEGVCGRCLMKQMCLGSCIAQNYYRSGNLWAPHWFCSEAEESGMFPESRLTAGP